MRKIYERQERNAQRRRGITLALRHFWRVSLPRGS